MLSQLVNSICGSNEAVTENEFLTKPPHKDEVINHGGITQEFRDGDEYWYKAGKLHRDGDLPVVIWSDDYQAWYRNGRLHGDSDSDGYKPAVVHSDGTVEYWVSGNRAK